MMMINTKISVAILALFAVSTSAVDNKDGRRNRRHLRKQKMAGNNNASHNNKKARKAKIIADNMNNKDITEDVAFWTRALQNSMPPTPRPPTPRPPTPRPPTPRPPTPNVTPAPVPVPPVPNPTNPPVTPTPPPVPAPAGNVPVARPDSASVPAGGDLAFVAVLGNDTPAQGQTLTVKSVTAASNGDCSIGLDLLEVVYSPNGGFTGTDSCDYEACDAQPECDTATITFTVG